MFSTDQAPSPFPACSTPVTAQNKASKFHLHLHPGNTGSQPHDYFQCFHSEKEWAPCPLPLTTHLLELKHAPAAHSCNLLPFGLKTTWSKGQQAHVWLSHTRSLHLYLKQAPKCISQERHDPENPKRAPELNKQQVEGSGPFIVSAAVITVTIHSKIYSSQASLAFCVGTVIWLEQSLCNAPPPVASGKKQTHFHCL